jgi:MinD superfamily P-loop ATPase
VSPISTQTLPLAASHAGQALVPELVVISGKGGTGKTSLLASFALLAEDPVLADCDVDAADLHLVLPPSVDERHSFVSGHEASVRADDCDGCGICVDTCRFDALSWVNGGCAPEVDAIACEGCGVCAHLCPVRAIDFVPRTCGEWFVSSTRCGPMVHARLGIAAENSGKLVSVVRAEARRLAVASGRRVILVDGPPGIGCPVIAAITGATAVLVVTEPTVSGRHDLERALGVARHFNIPASVCVNRWDIHPEGTRHIEDLARELAVETVGRIRYDPSVTTAQIRATPVVDLGGPAAEDIEAVWTRLQKLVFS